MAVRYVEIGQYPDVRREVRGALAEILVSTANPGTYAAPEDVTGTFLEMGADGKWYGASVGALTQAQADALYASGAMATVKVGTPGNVSGVPYSWSGTAWVAVANGLPATPGAMGYGSKLLTRYNPALANVAYTAGDCTRTVYGGQPEDYNTQRAAYNHPLVYFSGHFAPHPQLGQYGWAYCDQNRDASGVFAQPSQWSASIRTNSLVVRINLCSGPGGALSPFSIYINGQLLGNYTIPNVGQVNQQVLTFTGKAERTITIVSYGSGFYTSFLFGIDLQASYVPMWAPRVAVLGDSYTHAYVLTNPQNNWIEYMLQCFGLTAYAGLGCDGTGYTNAYTWGTFAQRAGNVSLVNPDIIIVAGGINDLLCTSDEAYAAAKALMRSLKSSNPNALILSLMTQHSPGQNVSDAVFAALCSGVRSENIPVADMSQSLVGAGYGYVAVDGVHYNDAGSPHMGLFAASALVSQL